MGMSVTMVMCMVVGVIVRHEKMLHYNITGVHVVAFASPTSPVGAAVYDPDFGADDATAKTEAA
jgi:hypothetical protein